MVGFHGLDLNDNGLVVGYAQTPPTGGQHRGFIFNRNTGQWTEIAPLPGGSWSNATAVNNNNQVCGYRSMTNDQSIRSAYILTDGAFVDLGLINGQRTDAEDINENGVVTGTLVVDGVVAPFLWDGATLVSLPTLAGDNTFPRALSDDNRVVGLAFVDYPGAPGGIVGQAFHWSQGVMTGLGVLPGHARSNATDVTSDGVVIGHSQPLSGGGRRAFLWYNGVMHELSELVDPTADFQVSSAGSVTDDGRMLAFGLLAIENVSAILSPIQVIGDANSDCRVDVLMT